MKRRRKRKQSNGLPQNRGSAFKKTRPPMTAAEFFAMPESLQELYLLDLELVGLVRAGLSRTKAMKQLKLKRTQAGRFAASAFRKLKNGRYVAKPYDRLLRVVMAISNDGVREVATRDSRQASKAGKHSAAVSRYLETGDDSPLRHFDGKFLTDSQGKKISLLTDLEELDALGSAGVLSFETIYARSL